MPDFIRQFPQLLNVGHLREIEKKTTLLQENTLCQQIYLIEKGCIRSWFNHEGNDISFQFFFEGEIVTSFESLKTGKPSLYNIETITDCRLRVIDKSTLWQLLAENRPLAQMVENYLIERLYHYQSLFISRIKNNPQQRYEELIVEQPHIFDRVPHHYIATYLGITPVSLSRIRAKYKKTAES